MEQEKTTPLPGFVKIFLGLAYVWAISLFFVFLGMTLFLSRFAGEAIPWAFVVLASAGCALAAVVGIHTRAQWAPTVCRLLCIIQIVTGIATIVLAGAVAIAQGLRYMGASLYSNEIYPILLAPVLCVTFIPVFFAWFRYFGESPRARAAFALPAREGSSPLPPLGIVLLRILCGMYLAGIVVVSLYIFGAASSFDSYFLSRGGVVGVFLSVLFPGLIFPLILLVQTHKPGARAGTVCGMLWVWVISSSFLGMGIWFTFVNLVGVDVSALIPLYYFARGVPVHTITLAVFAAALSWRFISCPEEGAWLRQPVEKGIALYSRLPLFAFLALWIVFNYAPFGSNSFIQAPIIIIVAVFTVIVAGTWLDTGVPYRGQQDKNTIIFAVLLFCIAALFVTRLVAARDSVHMLAHFSGRYVINAGLCIYALMVLKQKRIDASSPLAMPLPAGALYVLCICVMVGGIFSVISGAYAFIDGSSRDIERYGVILMRPGLWIGSFICPAIMISQFKRGVPSIGALIAVCIVWLAAEFSSEMQALFARVEDISRSFSYPFSRGWHALSAILVLFVMYAPHSKEFTSWRRSKNPSGVNSIA